MAKISQEELFDLMKKKFMKAGLNEEHADIVSDVLLHADLRGVDSHGALRVEYYCERIAKGGTNNNPKFEFKKTGPCSGVFEGDDGAGHVVAKKGMEEAIKMAKESGIAVVGMRNLGHAGALSYFVQMASREGLVSISLCQSDPMAVPYGAAEPFYGTHPIAFGAPGKDGKHITIDMATTISAWGRILSARAKGNMLPEESAVDAEGNVTNDPNKVTALLHIAGAKGYGLAMMVDILSGVMLNLPYGNKVTSMYNDLTEQRKLGHLHIVLDPTRFTTMDSFIEGIQGTIDGLHALKPAEGFSSVRYPGEGSANREEKNKKEGIEVVDDFLEYLRSDVVHSDRYDKKGAFISE